MLTIVQGLNGMKLSLTRSLTTTSTLYQSSCKAGTVLNLKIKKSGNEPVALADEEYPSWLWDMLDNDKKDKDLKVNDIMKWRKKQLNKQNTAKIKNNNFLSQM